MNIPPTTTNEIDWSARYETIQELLFDPDGLVENGAVYPIWLSESVFWYKRMSSGEAEIRIVDAESRSMRTFSVSTLGAAVEELYPDKAPIQDDRIHPISIDALVEHVRFRLDGKLWTFDLSQQTLVKDEKDSPRDGEGTSEAPNGARQVVLHKHNLFLRAAGSPTETALTTDGEEANSYANRPLASRAFTGSKLQGLWSPDSRYYFTLRTDERNVRSLPTMEYLPEKGIRPQVRTNRTSLPGDNEVTEFTPLIVDTVTGATTLLDITPLTAVRMNDTIFDAELVWWSSDSNTVYFVALRRGEKRADVMACDPTTGSTRIVFSETSDSPLELSVNVYSPALIKALPETNELVWYSERSGYGHLYLYDLKSGSVTRQLTDGPLQVREILAVDEIKREVFVLAAGVGSATNPYQGRPCKVSLDAEAPKLDVLRDEPGDHIVWRPNTFGLMALQLTTGVDAGDVSGFSPGADYFINTVCRIDGLPETTLCDRHGTVVMELERVSSSALPASWRWPIPVKTKAADGETEVHGLLFLPTDYDPAASYPVIDHIYGGPQVRNCPQGAFGDPVQTGTFIDTAAFAQLGAFALVLDGRGTTERGRDFRRASWREIHEASKLEDHIAAIRELKKVYPAMDLDRVGITGFSAGGYATAHAALRHGDFYSVAVAGGGNYDQSLFWHTWGERYHGAFDVDHYRSQAAKSYADGLSGKLLFIHGLRDWGCHPASLFQLMQVLNEKNKDYDVVLLPAAGHSLTGYGVRRRLDYFVAHLFGETPPTPHLTFTTKSDAVLAELLKRGPSVSEELIDAG